MFQMTFAAITPALIVGAFAERIKFSAVVLFCALWATFVYFPIAHMVWDANGMLFKMGALDFAGGTVVHINAGVAGLIGAIMVGKRTGYGKDMMAPHSMTLTMVGASMLWFGWFGFNAGSNLEASGYDDTADVFGVHGVGGMFGAVATGIFASASLGGVGYAEGVTMGGQVMTQITAIATTIVWCGVGSAILYKVVDLIVGLRVAVEAEREGLDLATHGEAAYHS